MSTIPGRNEAISGSIGLAIDGGNSKTEIVLLRLSADGYIAHARGADAGTADALPTDDARAAADPTAATPTFPLQTSPSSHELARIIAPGSGGGPLEVAAAVTHALEQAGGIPPHAVTRALAAVAGLDFPGDEEAHRAALASLLPRAAVEVVNDAVAVLDARAPGSAHGLAVVSGAGLNAVARGPLGLATVPAIGWPSGDWGGGDEIGREAVRVAARAADGRGPRTVLTERILELTGLRGMPEVGRAIRDGYLTQTQVGSFAGLVTQAAGEGDHVAAGIVARAVEEALLLADVVIRRAWGGDGVGATTPPATLAGGLFADPLFRAGVEEGLHARGLAPALLAHRPVDGLVAALLAESGLAAV